MSNAVATCIDISAYEQTLTYGCKYEIIGRNKTWGHPKIQIRNNRDRVRWYPANCFDLFGADAVHICSIQLNDNLSASALSEIEVEVLLSTGERRWCYFSIPEALYQFGDVLSGTPIRIHYGHTLIILTSLSEDSVKQALHHLLIHNQLITHTFSDK